MQIHRDELDAVVETVAEAIRRYLADVDERPVIGSDAEAALARFQGPLPESGDGAAAAVETLIRDGWEAVAATSGPRCFHFVIGGSTPAAMGADLLASAFDQLTYTWITSPLGVTLEVQAVEWLKELFGLPSHWHGVMVTGATMGNFVGLAAGRQWWGERQGVDIAAQGLAGLPPVPVFTSGLVHASTLKVAGMLGIGRNQVRRFPRDTFGRLDLEAFEAALAAPDGAPALVVANAGEVNAGEFDPLPEMIDIARRYDTWVHVDGAFGLFARCSERVAHLVEGIERADSVQADGHKWLNVPYDVGFGFVRDHEILGRAFTYTADYLPAPDDPRPTIGAYTPESSRRGRGFAVWATLKAYGREGVRELVEHCLDMAAYCGELVEAADDMVLLAPVKLNIVSFRYDPGGLSEEDLDAVNRAIGQGFEADGRVLAGTTLFEGRVAHRPAFSNWRTRREDVALYVQVVRELGEAAVRELRGTSD